MAGLFLLECGMACAQAPFPFGRDFEGGDTTTAVFSGTSENYARARTADGAYTAETYAFGNGGYYGSPSRDATIDKEGFMDIARVIARPLALHNFVPTKDPKKAGLLIMVYWGVTSGTLDPSSDIYVYGGPEHTKGVSWTNDLLGPLSFSGGLADLRNAMLLGYAGEIANTQPRLGVIHNVRRDDLIEDVEHNRYFVVMMAYDFQAMWREKKHKLLWETRFSIREQGNDFGRMLPSMSLYASQYFGQDSHGLVRKAIPEGSVEIGVPTTVGADAEKGPSLSDTTLIADADTFSSRSRRARPDRLELPAALAGRIAAYEREKAALQGALSARTGAQPPGEDTRRAIDSFNAENASRIAALKGEAESIRSDLAGISAAPSQAAGEPSVDMLVRQFNDSVQEIRIANPLYTHP
jgi:hypothetical protein